MLDTSNLQATLQNPNRLEKLHQLQLLQVSRDPVFDRLTMLASNILTMPISFVSFVGKEKQTFKSHVGLPEPWATSQRIPLRYSFCQYSLLSDKPLLIQDARTSPLVRDNPAIDELNAIAYAGIPLITSDQYALGCFCVVDRQPHQWSEKEIEILKNLATSVMTEIELRDELMKHKAAAAVLQETLTTQRELNDLKSRFISVASHEFRTPLSTIRVTVETLKTYYDRFDQETRDKRYDKVISQVDRLTGLLDDVLMINEMESSDLNINQEAINLDIFLRELMDEVQTDDMSDRILYHCEKPESSIVFADPKLMYQCFLNLLSNAIKYSTPDTTVTVTLTVQEDEVSVVIVDEGIGIPQSEQDKLFSNFFRASNVDTISGTGLGLSIAKHAIEQSGGMISFESIEDVGTTFTVTLPRYR